MAKSLTLIHRIRSRRALIIIAVVQIVLLTFIATWVMDIVIVEDTREVVDGVETISFRRELIGDPLLFVLAAIGMSLPLMSSRLRREPVMMLAVQLAIVALLIFVLWPVAQVFVEGFEATEEGGGYSLETFRRLFAKPMVARASRNTIWLGITSATLSTLIGAVVAYALTLTDIPWKRFLRILVVLTLVSPPFAVSFAFILLFGRRGLITYDILRIRQWTVYGPDGIILVQLVSNIPLAVLILMAVFASMNRDLEDAAEDLGAKTFRVLRTITFPLVTPALLTAWLLNFIASISDFGNPMLIGGGFQLLAPQAYIQRVELYDPQLSAALAMLLVIPALIAFGLQHRISNRRSYVTITGGARTGHVRKLPGLFKWPLFSIVLFLGLFNLLLYGAIFVGAAVKAWGFDYTLTTDNLKALLVTANQLRNSLVVAIGAGILGGFIGIILAWLVSRQRFPGRGALDFSGTLMYAIPGTVVGIGYIIAFNAAPYLLTGTFFIIIVAYAFRRLPVGLRSGVAADKQIDPSLEEASLDLGASRPRTFAKITFPLLRTAFLAGVIYIFIRSMTDLSAAIFLSSAKTQLFTVQMFNVMIRGSPSEAAAFAALLIVIILLALGILGRLTGKSFVDVFRIA
ncbi:MAG: ABC transporter permease [Anaerolineales bacterium]